MPSIWTTTAWWRCRSSRAVARFFTGSGRTEEVADLGARDEVELCQRQDMIALERRLEGEVKALQGFGRCETGRREVAVRQRIES